MGSETRFVSLYLLHHTEKAYLLADEEGEEYWIPKSQVQSIEYGDKITINERPAQEVEIEIPEWLAEDKGL